MPRTPPGPPGGNPHAPPRQPTTETQGPNSPPTSPEAAEDTFEPPQTPHQNPKFLPGTPVWTCTRSLLDVVAGNPGHYHPGVVRGSSFHLPHQRNDSLPNYTLLTPDGGTTHCEEEQLRSARPIPGDAWTEPTVPGVDFRSRYSGAPLRPNYGIITIVSQLSQAVAHSYVVFEWYDPFNHQRHHILYHLYPTEHSETHTEPTLWEKFTGTPGTVEKLEDSHHFFPRTDAKGELIPAGYRSWETSYTCMNKSMTVAKAYHQSPPLYSAHGYSGTESCSTMSTKILHIAGINTRSVLGNLLEVPRYENADNSTIDTEQALWTQRYTPLPATEYDVPVTKDKDNSDED